MVFEWMVSFGQVATAIMTLLGFFGGFVIFLFGLRTQAAILSNKLETLGGRMINVEFQLRELTDVVKQQAVQTEQILSLGIRMGRIEERQLLTSEQLSKLTRDGRGSR